MAEAHSLWRGHPRKERQEEAAAEKSKAAKFQFSTGGGSVITVRFLIRS